MRFRHCLFASAVCMLLINATPLPAANAAPVDICSLLTEAEVSAAVGVSMNSGLPVTPIGTHARPGAPCKWLPSGGFRPGAPPPIVNDLRLWAFPEEYFERDMVGENVTSVSGLGDEAYYVNMSGGYTVMDVNKGALCVQVVWHGPNWDHQEIIDAEQTIAAQVLSEL
jgi:hypothetical protein